MPVHILDHKLIEQVVNMKLNELLDLTTDTNSEPQSPPRPDRFNNAQDFCNYVEYNMGLKDPYCENQGGGAWIAFDGDNVVAIYNAHNGLVDFDIPQEEEEWGVKHTGENTKQSIATLQHQAAAAKRSGNIHRYRQKEFAVRAKQHWE